ncbi:asparagine--tRNA ligase [Ketobacter sp.]|uniref:asparagine--tRNA ligase n=1 Tax=Ketobacter sp. TaxID=2083498 RepID=UPI000F206E9B|nr:asparagine--tRNA ligase [Ketobacter sp.]RLU01588.1 MAG: asparagine--tRNA ligase [Ketobacter sp.]
MDWPVQIVDCLAGKLPVGQSVTLKGWVRTRRDSKAGFSFVNLHDGSCFDGIQIVADKSLPNYESDILKLGAGCSLVVQGEIVASQGKEQAVEIQAAEVSVLGWVDDPESYPVAKKRHTFEYLRTVAHLRPRTNTFGAIARIRNTASQAIHRYFNERNFYWVNTPVITASDCEGAGEMFRVSTLDLLNVPTTDQGKVDFSQDFFANEAFLTVSGQLNGEAYCTALSRVYTFGPTFRAENSHTSRHLAEFWMVEPEVAFADLNANADMAEEFLQYVFKAVLEERADDMGFFAKHINGEVISRLENVIASEFVRMDYSEAIRILEQCGKTFEFPVQWGLDLQSEHERYLAEEHVGRPVILMNYPREIKAFYMRENDDGRTCAAMDVLAPGIGEIIGGSQREERLEILDRKMAALGLAENLWWYRDLRRYGTIPHAGFGLGFERLLNYITGMENIRDAIPFPRVPGSALF